MPTWLTGITAKLIAGGVILSLLGGAYLRYEFVINERDVAVANAATLKQDLQDEKAVNDQNVAELTKIKGDLQRASDAQVKAQRDADDRAVELSKVKDAIAHAAAKDRGPVPGVITNVLRSMLGGNAGTSGDNQDKRGAAASASGSSVVLGGAKGTGHP